VISRLLLRVYFLLLPLKQFPSFSGFIPKATLADFVFIPIGLLALSKYRLLLDRAWWTVFDFLAIAWFLAETLSLALKGASGASLPELAAAFYMVCLYFSVRLLIGPKHVEEMVSAVIGFGFVWGALSIIGWGVATAIQHDSLFVFWNEKQPYLGHTYRVMLLTGSPNMLLSFLMPGILFCWARLLVVGDHRFICSGALGIMVVAMFLTFSRGVLLIFGSMAVIYILSLPAAYRATRWAKLLLPLIVISAASAFILVSHIIAVSPYNEAAVQKHAGLFILADRPLLAIGDPDTGIGLYPGLYLELKKAALLAFEDSKGLGLGGGNFNEYLKGNALFHKDATGWDPHSTYFGALAEHGIIGFLTACAIFAYLCGRSFLKLRKDEDPDFISIAFAGVFLEIAIEAICLDVMNFRQYWVLFALAATWHSIRSHSR